MSIRAWDPLIYSSTPAASRARERLDGIDRLVDWDRFDRHLRWLDSAPLGRRADRPLTLFKALLLEQWFSLCAAEFEFEMTDRACYRRFLGLADSAPAPSHAAVCAFRRLLLERGVAVDLFAELHRQLCGSGAVLTARDPDELDRADGAGAFFDFNIDVRPWEWIALERRFLNYWHGLCGERDAPLLSDVKLDDVPEMIKPYLVLVRILPDGEFLHESIGDQLESANEGTITGSTIDERLQRNLNQYEHAGLYGVLSELYRSVSTQRRAAGSSTYYFNAGGNKCQLWIVQAPLCDAGGAVTMLLGTALILPVSVN